MAGLRHINLSKQSSFLAPGGLGGAIVANRTHQTKPHRENKQSRYSNQDVLIRGSERYKIAAFRESRRAQWCRTAAYPDMSTSVSLRHPQVEFADTPGVLEHLRRAALAEKTVVVGVCVCITRWCAFFQAYGA